MCSQSTISKLDSGTHVIVPKWFTIIKDVISPTLMITGLFYLGVQWNSLEARTFSSYEQKIEVLNHVRDMVSHMPYQEKIKIFVPRTEIEYKLENLDEKVDKIMDELNVK